MKHQLYSIGSAEPPRGFRHIETSPDATIALPDYDGVAVFADHVGEGITFLREQVKADVGMVATLGDTFSLNKIDGSTNGSYSHVTVREEMLPYLDELICPHLDTMHEKERQAAADRLDARLFRALLKNSTFGITYIDRDFRIIKGNNAHGELLNKSVEDMIGKLCYRELEQSDQVCPDCPGVDSVIDGQQHSRLIEEKRDDGSSIWLNRITVPVYGDEEQLLGFIKMVEDVSDRKAAEEKLRANEENLRITLNSIGDAVIATDTYGKITRMNPVAERLTGWSLEEAIHKPLTDAFHIVNAHTGATAINPVMTVLEKGETVGLANHTMLLAKNGEEYQIADSAAPIRDVEGKISGVVLVFRDVTEEYRVQEELQTTLRNLQESESKLREAQAMAHLGNWLWNVKTGEVEWSDEVYNIFQLDPDQFTPQIDSIKALSSSWSEDSQRHNELIRRAIESHEHGTYEQRFLLPDGSTGYYTSTFQGIYDERGELTAIKGTVQDITERKRAEIKYQETTAILRTAMDCSTAGIAIADAPDGKLRYVNDAGLGIRGKGHKEVVEGIGISEYVESWQVLDFDGTPYAEDEVPLARAILYGEQCDRQFIIRRPDNEDRIVWATAAPVFNDDGEVIAGIVVFPDITELKQAEESLRISEEKYRALFNNAPLSYQSLDENGHFLDVNPAWLRTLGYEREEVIGQCYADFLHPDWRPHFEKNFPEFKRRGYISGVEFKIRAKDGTYRDIAFEGCAGYWPDGRFRQTYCVFQDITARKKAEESLRKIEWLLDPDSVCQEQFESPYGDLTQLNTSRVILDSVGEEILAEIAEDYIVLLGTSGAIYEANGDYALGIFSSGWCQFLDSAARSLCNTSDNAEALACGKWLCHESCWEQCAKVAMQSREPVDIECSGGIHLYAVPIFAGEEIVGAMNVGWGDPPTDHEKLLEISEKYGVPLDRLEQETNAYESRPPFIIEMAKRRLETAARLIGEIVYRKQTEKLLRKSEERFRAIFENMTNGVAIYKPIRDGDKFIFKDINPAGARIGQINREDHIGRSLLEVYPGVKTMGLFDVFQEVYRTGKSHAYPMAVYEDDRISLYVENYVCKLPSGEIAAIYDDITERKQAEFALRDSEQRLIEAQRIAQIGDFTWEVDTGKVRWSAAMYELMGYSPSETITYEVVVNDIHHPDDLNRVTKWLEKCVTSGGSELTPNEYRLIRKDGTCMDVRVKGVIARHEGISPIMFGTVQDITEVKKTEEELRRHREHLQQMVEERTWELSEAKDAAEHALADLRSTQDQLIQSEKLAVLGRLAAGVAHEVNSPLGAIGSSAEMMTSSYTRFMDHLDDLVLWMQEDSSLNLQALLKNSLAAPPLTLSTRERRSLRKRLRDELPQFNTEIRDSLIDLIIELDIHDSYTNFLSTFEGESAPSRIELLRSLLDVGHGVGIIETAAQKATRIIKALQTYAQRRPDEEITSVDVRHEIETVLTLYHNRYKGDVEVVRRYEDVPMLECYCEELSQIWTNMILNALQAMDYRGRLVITVRSLDEQILISFKDTGCGIPETLRERIFEPFFTTKQSGEGCGLGLDVVRSIVQRHHGHIDFESQEQQGTTFTIQLPIRQPVG